VKVLAWATSATSLAYMNFLELVQAMSAVYVLKRIGDNTDPCGSPFCSILQLLTFPLRDTLNFLLEIKFSSSLNVVLHFIILASFSNSPLF
jgi:hypothetical protein